MSATGLEKRITPPDIQARKGADPLVVLTAYTTPVARLVDPHCDIVLVGDSVAMVLHGHPTTLQATMEMMVLHGQSVARGLSQALEPHSSGGYLLNFLGEEGEDTVRRAFGTNYPRLAELKRRYDPTNFFRLNQNIQPAA